MGSSCPDSTHSGSPRRSEEHTSELQSHHELVCRLLLEKKNAKSVGNPGNIYNLLGAYIPFPVSRAEREARNDPRRSIGERYPDRDAYLQRIKNATPDLV